jgi:hypothetical protein
VHIYYGTKKQLSWDIYPIRRKGEYLARVEAPDQEGAINSIIKALSVRDPVPHPLRISARPQI